MSKNSKVRYQLFMRFLTVRIRPRSIFRIGSIKSSGTIGVISNPLASIHWVSNSLNEPSAIQVGWHILEGFL